MAFGKAKLKKRMSVNAVNILERIVEKFFLIIFSSEIVLNPHFDINGLLPSDYAIVSLSLNDLRFK